RVERRMLQEPHHLAGMARCDGLDPGLHEGDGVLIADEAIRDGPFHRFGAGLLQALKGQAVSQVRHRFTLLLRDAERHALWPSKERRSLPRIQGIFAYI